MTGLRMNCRYRECRSARQNHVVLRRAAVVAAVLWGCGAPAAYAAQWEFLPRVDVGALANDNYTLTPDSAEKVSVSGGWVDAALALRATTPLTEFTLTPQLSSTYLPGDEVWESDDRFLRLDWSREGQRFTAALRGDYADEATLSSELPSSDVDGDLGDPDSGDAGFVTVRNRRERLQLLPRVSFAVTQRSTILLDAAYQDVDYDQEILGDTTSYSNTSASIGYQFRTSPTSTLTLRGTASRFEPDVGDDDSDSYGARVEWASRRSEVTRWYVRAGAEQVDIPVTGSPGATNSETGYEGGVGVDWKFQVTRLFIDATLSVDPNATGRVIERDQLRLRLTRQFSPRLSGFFGARATRDTALSDEAATFRDRDYATGSVGLEWRMTREFSLVGQYDVTWQEYEASPADATANSIQLSIVYARGRGD